jgi:hypothetical protein
MFLDFQKLEKSENIDAEMPGSCVHIRDNRFGATLACKVKPAFR